MADERVAHEREQAFDLAAIELIKDLPPHPRRPVPAEMRRDALLGLRSVGQRSEELADSVRHVDEVHGIHATGSPTRTREAPE